VLVELCHSSFSKFLNSPDRKVRQTAFHEFYKQFDAHKNTIAATLDASVQRDVYYAKARGYKSAIECALFPDNVPMSVYDNLIKSVHKNLPALYRFYDLRKRKMKLKEIHHYDTYVPILADLQKRTSWDDAVKIQQAAMFVLVRNGLKAALTPYREVLQQLQAHKLPDRPWPASAAVYHPARLAPDAKPAKR